jgi:cell division topological specificity factor
MKFFNLFRIKQKKVYSAKIAKERLKIIVSHQNVKLGSSKNPPYLDKLQKEILEVIKKYVYISHKDIRIELDTNNKCSTLELNITLPDKIGIEIKED